MRRNTVFAKWLVVFLGVDQGGEGKVVKEIINSGRGRGLSKNIHSVVTFALSY